MWYARRQSLRATDKHDKGTYTLANGTTRATNGGRAPTSEPKPRTQKREPKPRARKRQAAKRSA